MFGDLTAEARVVWKGGLMELLSWSEVEGVGFLGFFFPKMYQAIAVKTWFFEAFWQARAGSGYSLVRHACGNVVFQFSNQATEGGQTERERDTTHGGSWVV